MSRNVGLVGQAPCYTPFSQQMSSAVGSIASMIAINEKHQNAYVPPPLLHWNSIHVLLK